MMSRPIVSYTSRDIATGSVDQGGTLPPTALPNQIITPLLPVHCWFVFCETQTIIWGGSPK